MDPKQYHVCWPLLTAKRVEPVVSISWASCLYGELHIMHGLCMQQLHHVYHVTLHNVCNVTQYTDVVQIPPLCTSSCRWAAGYLFTIFYDGAQYCCVKFHTVWINCCCCVQFAWQTWCACSALKLYRIRPKLRLMSVLRWPSGRGLHVMLIVLSNKVILSVMKSFWGLSWCSLSV